MRYRLLILIGFCCGSVGYSAVDQYAVVSERLLSNVRQVWGVDAEQRVRGWDQLMYRQLQDSKLSDWAKISQANSFFNQVEWLGDEEHWGVQDYWATPIETLASNGGDCEDFSIGKYFTLLYSKVSPEKLRITYVKSLEYNQAHMVLTYYATPGAEPLVLDNIKDKILPASKRTDLVPIYSFNGDSVWLAQGAGRKLGGSSKDSLPNWQKVNQKIADELAR